ncbi:MAG: MFS transporter [Rhodospirillales bacterium]|nr:MFS transporter [Rhodospirillales bacterium]
MASVETVSETSILGRAFANPMLWLMGGFGFASGLPLPLSGFTLRQWFAEGHVSLGAIGLTAEIGLSYSLKFLWAPLMDHAAPPGVLARFGRRRGWLLTVQPALVLSVALLALSRPAVAPALAAGAAALVAFLSASQDIVIDAWRIETFPARLQGAAMAAYVWGYRAALLISGAGAIALATPLGWHLSLFLMAGLAAFGIPVTLAAREPPPPASGSFSPHSLRQRLAESLVAPLQEFLARPGAVPILAFVVLFRLGEAMAGVMLPPFYRALGFNRAAVALASGPVSLAAVLVGAALGGWLVARLGVGRALLFTGWVQTLCLAMYVLLAYSAGSHGVLLATSAVESFTEGLADAAFITYLSGLCSRAHTATQYALLSSVAALALRTVGGLSGFLAAAAGWKLFYSLTTFAAFPAMGVMIFLLRRFPPEPKPAPEPRW